MKPIKLIIKTNSEKYPIFIGKNLITKISSLMVNNSIKSKKCLLVVDRKVPKKFISEIKKYFCSILMPTKKIRTKLL